MADAVLPARTAFNLPAALKEAGLTAFIVCALAFPLVGFHIKDVPGGIDLVTRFMDVLAAGLYGFLGRMALIGLREHRFGKVLIGCLVVGGGLAIVMVAEQLSDPDAAAAIARLRPFNDAVVSWIIVIVCAVFASRAIANMGGGGANMLGHLGKALAASGLGALARVLLGYTRALHPGLVIIGSLVVGGGLIVGLYAERLLGLSAETAGWLRPFDNGIALWVIVMGCAAFAISAVDRLRDGEQDGTENQYENIGQAFQHYARFAGPLIFVFALVLPMMFFADRRIVDIATLVMTYVMLGWGLNIVVGLAGLLDLGYVAFYAVGAYSFALLAQYFDFNFWICLPLAGFFAASAGVLLGFPVLRLRGDYLAIVTLGFGEMVRIILLNWYDFTNGPDGISGIPKPTLFGLEFSRRVSEGGTSFFDYFGLEYSSMGKVIYLYYIIIMLAMITNLFTIRIRKLPIGRAWEALREDEIACRSLGINPTNTKLTAFGIGAMFGGFAGSFFATRQGFISPESFTFIESAIILAIVVLGGMGSQLGVVVAAVVLIGMPELFRELGQYRMLAFGAGMVLIMLWRPRGLLSYREPTIRLHARDQGRRQ